MADILRIKRRISGAPGAPASLANAEIAYNEVDHTLYYGEGTGGAGGTATVVVPIGGSGLASNATPLMNGTAAPGASAAWSRGDHVHPSDTTKANLANPTFTGTVTVSGNLSVSGTVSGAGFTAMLLPYAPLASPVFTGTPSLPSGTIAVTQPNGTNNTTPATTAYVLATRLDQFAPPAAPVNFNNQRIIGLTDPQAAQDGATKNYVDTVAQGLSGKGACVAATTTNLTLSGTQTIDGIAVNIGDRVLVKNQTVPAQNGIYVVAAGGWARSTDADTWNELVAAFTFVEQGAVNGDNGYLCTVDPGGTLNTTAVTWVQFSGAGQITAGNGLTKTGNVIDAVGIAGRIAVGADNIDIDATYVGQTSIVTLGSVATGTWNATTVAVNHGGTGATALTGYVKGNGISPFTASATIPTTDIPGLGTMALQNATAVAITGGTIDGITFDGGTF